MVSIDTQLIRLSRSLFLLENSLNSFKGSLSPVTQALVGFQNKVLQLGFPKATTKLVDLGISDLPGLTEMSVATNILSNGLERNSKFLGQYLGISELLGENTEAVASSIRQLTNSMLLSDNQQKILVKGLYDTADTYKVSTEGLIASVAKMSQQLPVQMLMGNQNLIAAMGKVQARLGPEADPDLVGKILTPFLAGGYDIQPTEALLGVAGLTEQLNMSGQSVATLETQLLTFINKLALGGTSLASTIGNTRQAISAYGQQLQLAAPAAQAANILEKRPQPNAATERKLSDVNSSINALQKALQDPLATLSLNMLKLLEYVNPGVLVAGFTGAVFALGKIFLSSISVLLSIRSAVGQIIGLMGGVIAGANPLTSFTALFSKLPKVFGTVLGGIFKVAFGPIGLLVTTLLSFLPIWEWIGGSSEEAAESSEETSRGVRDLVGTLVEPAGGQEAGSQILIQEAALLASMFRLGDTAQLERQSKTEETKQQLAAQQIGLLGEVVEGLKRIEAKRMDSIPLSRRNLGGF